MTQEQIEAAIQSLLELIAMNTAAIRSLSDSLANYSTIGVVNDLTAVVNSNSIQLTQLQNTVASLLTNIGFVNKLSKLLDINITNPTKNDVLQYDGDRWVNIKPSKLISNKPIVAKLEDLTNVNIVNVNNGQALIYDNASSKWINSTIQSAPVNPGTGGTSTFDETTMWALLGTAGANTIHPSHITGDLNVASVTTTGEITAYNTES